MIGFGYNVYSQFGEDGILQHIIGELDIIHQSCEFGMSGVVNSNTYNLAKNYNWKSVFIEKDLSKITGIEVGEIIIANIETDGINSFDNTLKNTNIDSKFGILSIDVDGNDYHIWNSIKEYTPSIVIIEFNPFLPPKIEHIYDGVIFSSSFISMINLAKSKGYSLLCMSGNLIFGKNEILIGTSFEKYIDNDPYNLYLNDAIMTGEKTYSFKRYVKRNII